MLLACRQWDPLGLARWLPSLRVGAWRSAPLLPWRVQCPVRVCPVLGARDGTWCCVSPVFPFLCRGSRAVCGWPSRPGVPYPRSLVRHSTRSVRSASSVRLPFWYSPRALCLCVRSRSRVVRFPSPPPLIGVARAPRAVPALGAGRAVPRGPCPSACPAPVAGSIWRAWGGRAARSRFPTTWLGAVPLPWGGSARPGHSRAGGGGLGGGGQPVRRAPRLWGRGGLWGGGSLCLVPFLCLPWAGNKAGVTGVVLVMEGVARLFSAVPVGVGGWGGGAGLAPGPLSGAAFPPGGGGTIPSALGGWGPAPPRLAGRRGGGWGGSRRGPPALPLGGGTQFPTLPPSRRRRIQGPPRAPVAAPTDQNPPSAPPEWATLWVSRAMLWSWGARPPYCSGSLSRAAPGRGPCVTPARWCGLACRPRPPRERAAGGAGARGVRVQLRHPPPHRGPFWGRGGVPSAPGGAEIRRSCGPQAGGERGGGGRSAAPRPPAPSGVGLPSFVSGAPSMGYTRAVGVAGLPWA